MREITREIADVYSTRRRTLRDVSKISDWNNFEPSSTALAARTQHAQLMHEITQIEEEFFVSEAEAKNLLYQLFAQGKDGKGHHHCPGSDLRQEFCYDMDPMCPICQSIVCLRKAKLQDVVGDDLKALPEFQEGKEAFEQGLYWTRCPYYLNHLENLGYGLGVRLGQKIVKLLFAHKCNAWLAGWECASQKGDNRLERFGSN